MTASVRVNGEEVALIAANVAELLAARGVAPEAKAVAVARNGQVVPRRQWASTSLEAGDVIEIVRPLQGG